MTHQQKYDEIIELLIRNQNRHSVLNIKNEFINLRIGESKKGLRFPIQHLFYLPTHMYNAILQHVNEVGTIKLDFKGTEANPLLTDYYSRNLYENISKYRKETIKVWHAFNKNKYWGYDESILTLNNVLKGLRKSGKMGKWD